MQSVIYIYRYIYIYIYTIYDRDRELENMSQRYGMEKRYMYT